VYPASKTSRTCQKLVNRFGQVCDSHNLTSRVCGREAVVTVSKRNGKVKAVCGKHATVLSPPSQTPVGAQPPTPTPVQAQPLMFDPTPPTGNIGCQDPVGTMDNVCGKLAVATIFKDGCSGRVCRQHAPDSILKLYPAEPVPPPTTVSPGQMSIASLISGLCHSNACVRSAVAKHPRKGLFCKQHFDELISAEEKSPTAPSSAQHPISSMPIHTQISTISGYCMKSEEFADGTYSLPCQKPPVAYHNPVGYLCHEHSEEFTSGCPPAVVRSCEWGGPPGTARSCRTPAASYIPSVGHLCQAHAALSTSCCQWPTGISGQICTDRAITYHPTIGNLCKLHAGSWSPPTIVGGKKVVSKEPVCQEPIGTSGQVCGGKAVLFSVDSEGLCCQHQIPESSVAEEKVVSAVAIAGPCEWKSYFGCKRQPISYHNPLGNLCREHSAAYQKDYAQQPAIQGCQWEIVCPAANDCKSEATSHISGVAHLCSQHTAEYHNFKCRTTYILCKCSTGISGQVCTDRAVTHHPLRGYVCSAHAEEGKEEPEEIPGSIGPNVQASEKEQKLCLVGTFMGAPGCGEKANGKGNTPMCDKHYDLYIQPQKGKAEKAKDSHRK
jgi:hypothetical protein